MDLKEARSKLGLTQVEAAERYGVSPKTWWNWEARQTAIPAGTAELIQLHVSIKTQAPRRTKERN